MPRCWGVTGLLLYTTLDLDMQTLGEQIVREQVDAPSGRVSP